MILNGNYQTGVDGLRRPAQVRIRPGSGCALDAKRKHRRADFKHVRALHRREFVVHPRARQEPNGAVADSLSDATTAPASRHLRRKR